MALLKNLFVLIQFAPINFVDTQKRVSHIWLILTLLTLFSFQRTPNRLLRSNIMLTFFS